MDDRPPDPHRLAELAAPPVFVIGSPRSGTTWVYNILTLHPQTAGVFESWLLTDDTGLGALLKDRNWKWEHAGLGQLLTRAQLQGELRAFASSLLSRALEPHHRFLVEKSPSARLTTVHAIFPEARVIHCLRDGRDVAASVKAASRSWAPQWRGTLASSTYHAAKSWRRALREVRRTAPALGAQFLEVRYEDLRAEPREMCRRIFDFCRMPHDEELLDDVVAQTEFDKVYEGGDDQFFRRGRVGDWRRSLSRLDAVLFEAGARRCLHEEGYASRWWWLRRFRP